MNLPIVRVSSLNCLHPFGTAYSLLHDQFCTLALKLLREVPRALCDLALMSWLIQVWTLDKYV